MIIHHPLLGPRDSAEFVYLGAADLMSRPDPETASAEDWHDYAYLRDNPAGTLRELWFHESGDRSILIVTRDTNTHEISSVELARKTGARA